MFERSMHSHLDILKYKYTQPIHNDIKSTECYLVTQNELKEIIKIMKKHVNDYNTDIELIRLRVREKELDPENV